MAGDGQFVVAWTAFSSRDGSGAGVYAARFDAAGNAVGSEFRVNTFTTGEQRDAAVAVDSSGDFVITWQSQNQVGSSAYDVYSQRYDAAGNALGSEFLVNTYTSGDQSFAAVAMDAAGDFVVTWCSAYYTASSVIVSQDLSGNGIYAQRYNASGVAQGSEFRVNTSTYNGQSYPSIASDPAGNFTIAWESEGQYVLGTSLFRTTILAQRYHTDGTAWGGELAVSDSDTLDQRQVAMSVDGNDRMVVAWQGRRNVIQYSDSAATKADRTSNYDVYVLCSAPVAVDDDYSAVLNQALSVNSASGVLNNDSLSGSSITAILVSGPANGSVSLAADGSFTYTPNTNFAGVDTFSYKVRLGTEYSTVATVSIAVVDATGLAAVGTGMYNRAMEGALSSLSSVSSILATMNTDGSFSTCTYTTSSTAGYETHANNLRLLAQGIPVRQQHKQPKLLPFGRSGCKTRIGVHLPGQHRTGGYQLRRLL